MKHMEKSKNFIKRNYKKAGWFFTHLPLFAKYLAIMTSMILVSYIVLASALLVFLSNRWSHEKKDLFIENVQRNAQYCETIFDRCKDENDVSNAMLLIGNNLAVISNAINADVFMCNMNGSVVLCKEEFDYDSHVGDDGCIFHKKYTIPQDILEKVSTGLYCDDDKVENLFDEPNLMVGMPVKVNGTVIGAVFACDPVKNSFAQYAGSIMKMYLSSAIFSICLSFLVAYALTARLTNPLRQMSNATKAYARGDFSKRINVRGSDEVAELCTSFNRMASALSVLESSRRSFVANVSHELKTPMTTIGGFIDGMLDGTIPQEKHPEYLSRVSEEVKRLSRLVTSMLNLSKIEAGELELKMTDFDISGLVLDCMLTFEQAIDNKNITVHGFESMQPAKVHADRDMIYQVVYNLVDNAVKFTNENGIISVFTGENKEGLKYIAIQNTGDGVSSEEIGKIFERFYKVDKSRSYDVKSAGLGLYLCKTIVEMHNGKIYAESVEGQFTRVTVLLPDNNK